MQQISFLLIILVCIVYPDDSTTELFTPLEYRYTGGRYEDEVFGFRLYIPEEAGTAKKYPLIVWLHGYGEGGTKNNREQLAWLELIFKDFKHLQYPPFFLLASQCPPDNRGWYRGYGSPSELMANEKGDEPITILREIIDKTISEYNIDVDRICLSGVSSGGSGCWEMAMRYPDLFAAVAPLASSGGDIERVGRIKETSIWAFHSERDNPEQVRRTMQALKEEGGRCHLTEVPGKSHYCQVDAFRDYDLLGWLLSQNRASTTAPEPGNLSSYARWKVLRRDFLSWEPLIPVATVSIVVGLIAVAWRSEIRRHIGKQRETNDSPTV